MGLDMYLNRMPRYKGVTANQISGIEDYFSLEKEKKAGGEHADCTLKQWCGFDEADLPDKETIEYFRQFYKTYYSDWDVEKKYGWDRIHEEVGYWRKANQIHAWFVEHVQDGIDDCDYHHEVTQEILEELLEVCKTVLENSKLVDGKVFNGYTINKDGTKNNEYVDGKIIKNCSVAQDLLPTTSGFFFGCTEYDEYYIQDLKNTISIVTKVLETTDFETQMIYYVSSW